MSWSRLLRDVFIGTKSGIAYEKAIRVVEIVAEVEAIANIVVISGTEDIRGRRRLERREVSSFGI